MASQLHFFFPKMRIFKTCCLRNVHICSIVLLTVVTTLYISSPGLIYLIPGSLHLLTTLMWPNCDQTCRRGKKTPISFLSPYLNLFRFEAWYLFAWLNSHFSFSATCFCRTDILCRFWGSGLVAGVSIPQVAGACAGKRPAHSPTLPSP